MILYKIDKNDRGRKVLFFYHEKIDSVHSLSLWDSEMSDNLRNE